MTPTYRVLSVSDSRLTLKQAVAAAQYCTAIALPAVLRDNWSRPSHAATDYTSSSQLKLDCVQQRMQYAVHQTLCAYANIAMAKLL
eukprot:12435-Heterococcus_DN1.PRE.1